MVTAGLKGSFRCCAVVELLATGIGLRSDGVVWRRLNRRGVVHCFIVALFLGAALGLEYLPRPDDKPTIQNRIKRWYESLEYSSVDLRIRLGRTAQVNPEIVFVAIDQASTSTYLDSVLDPATIAASRPLSLMHASFPYPREVYALTCDRLFGAGAKVVALDVLFLGPSANDGPIKAALDRYRDQLVIGMNFGYDPLNGKTTSLAIPSASLLPDQDPFDPLLGYINYWADSDDVVRDAAYRDNIEDVNGQQGAEQYPELYSFAARAIVKSGRPDLAPDDLGPRTLRFAGAPMNAFKIWSLYEIFDPKAWERNFLHGEFFRNKIVVVGPEGDFAKDKSSTAYGLMDGAEIHLNAINCLLQGDFLHKATRWQMVLFTLAAGGLALLLGLFITEVGWRFLTAVGLVAGYLVALMVAYNGPGWLLPAVAPLTVFCGATAVGYIYDFVLAQIERLRLRTALERYNSRNVVKYLLDHTTSHEEMQKGTRRAVTVLFSDIRGFTTMVEEATDSQRLVDQLNEYFTEMVSCVFTFDGSLDKFMGDGIMAIWGNTPYNFGPKEDAIRAVRAALAMGEALRRLNAKWRTEGREEWVIGIALNHGQVIVGDMGSQQRKEFGVLGDAINLASRLEGLTKEYHLQLLIGESVAELVGDTFHLRSVDVVQVKGRTGAVRTYTVLGEKSAPLPPGPEQFLALHEEGMVAFRRRDFARAREVWLQALEIQPDDFILRQYVESCTGLIEKPPGEAWTGVRVMTRK